MEIIILCLYVYLYWLHAGEKLHVHDHKRSLTNCVGKSLSPVLYGETFFNVFMTSWSVESVWKPYLRIDNELLIKTFLCLYISCGGELRKPTSTKEPQ